MTKTFSCYLWHCLWCNNASKSYVAIQSLVLQLISATENPCWKKESSFFPPYNIFQLIFGDGSTSCVKGKLFSEFIWLALQLHNTWIQLMGRSIGALLEIEGEKGGGQGNFFSMTVCHHTWLGRNVKSHTQSHSHNCFGTTGLKTTSLFCSETGNKTEWNILNKYLIQERLLFCISLPQILKHCFPSRPTPSFYFLSCVRVI